MDKEVMFFQQEMFIWVNINMEELRVLASIDGLTEMYFRAILRME
jgi:hypothetical protein